jgi:hypothetical protein
MRVQAGGSKHDRCTQCLVASRGGKTRAIRIALTAKHEFEHGGSFTLCEIRSPWHNQLVVPQDSMHARIRLVTIWCHLYHHVMKILS